MAGTNTTTFTRILCGKLASQATWGWDRGVFVGNECGKWVTYLLCHIEDMKIIYDELQP